MAEQSPGVAMRVGALMLNDAERQALAELCAAHADALVGRAARRWREITREFSPVGDPLARDGARRVDGRGAAREGAAG